MITLYAPRKVGNRWRLKADVELGRDELSLSAYLSPRTVHWAIEQARRGFDWGRSATNQIGQALGHYIRLRGDWNALGPIADMAASTAYRLRQHPLFLPYDELREGLPLYHSYTGVKGEKEKQQALQRIHTINQRADSGDPQAKQAQFVLHALHRGDEVLHAPDRYDTICNASHDTKFGNQSASVLLGACKALGSCDGRHTDIHIPYDGDRLLAEPNKVDKLAGYANDMMLFRSFGKCPAPSNGSLSELLTTLCEPLQGEHSQTGMPYYGAGYNPDDEWYGRSVVPGYGGNPDETDRRGRLWGYNFTPWGCAGTSYPHGSDE